MKNQCDGCNAKWPMKGNTHFPPNWDGTSYPNTIGCTADRYGHTPPAELVNAFVPPSVPLGTPTWFDKLLADVKRHERK